MNIPIQNIYYLLCYAWDKLEERDIVIVNAQDNKDILDLLGNVLANGTLYLFKHGLDRNYIETKQTVAGVRGKLLLTSTVKQNLLPSKRTLCAYDEFSYDILHNQILRTTLARLLQVRQLDGKIRHKIKTALINFPPVQEISIRPSTFSRIRLHRNNYFYDFVLKVCEMVHSCTFFDESSGEMKFRDFIRDEKKMAYLFEAFIRNFYRRELSGFRVSREDINWQLLPLNEPSARLLPKMQTDISLTNSQRKIIIETKYYQETLVHHHDVVKIRSNHLYQLYAYLKNGESKKTGQQCEAILLYPTVDRDVRADYKMEDHIIKVRAVNLNQDWKRVEKELLGFLYS